MDNRTRTSGFVSQGYNCGICGIYAGAGSYHMCSGVIPGARGWGDVKTTGSTIATRVEIDQLRSDITTLRVELERLVDEKLAERLGELGAPRH